MTTETAITEISTHVLDVMMGRPAAGLAVRFELRRGGGWQRTAAGHTDANGRIPGWRAPCLPGVYRLVFDTAEYFIATGRTYLYPEVVVHLKLDGEHSYHVPLLIGPFAYSTYLGS